jgi:hypothetical protein
VIARTLKYVLIVVVVAVIAYAALSVYGEVTETEAARMSDSVALSENQAANMNRALGEVSVFAAGSSVGNPSETGLPTQNSEISKITSIDELIGRWEPRYEGAKLAYVKFEAAIDNAKASAAGYFAAQQAVTERINDPEIKAQAREDDDRDLTLYRQWEAQANLALAKARAIGMQLDDMDASLRKLELRTDFVFDSSSFREVPAAILELNAELSEFRAASETIRAATESPFEPK